MKNDEKTIIIGVGAILAYFFLEQKKEKKVSVPNLSIYPSEFYA